MHDHPNIDSLRETRLRTLLDKLLSALQSHPVKCDDLGHGRSGLALVHFYYGACFQSQKEQQAGLGYLEEIFENMGSGQTTLYSEEYYRGLTGFLSVVNSLKNDDLLDIDFDDFSSLEQMIYEWSLKQLDQGNMDFFYGASGSLCYFIGRLPDQQIETYIDGIIERFIHLMEPRPGTYAIINSFYNKEDKRQVNEINFSLVHGMAAVILNLTNLYDKGYRKHDIARHIHNCIHYLRELSAKADLPEPYCYAGTLNCDNNEAAPQRRLGWCFSDLNIIHLLYRAGYSLSNQEWIDEADGHCATITGRTNFEHTLVNNVHLCHGSAGIALYYQKLYEMTGNHLFQAAHIHWLEDTLSRLEHWEHHGFMNPDQPQEVNPHSFFYGLPGVLLCLLSAYDLKSCNWSKIILL
jgi:lantibiotic modifying enzyme